jgi:hypothetical protein
MAHGLFGGDVPKNFAIQGHPPWGSHEYVMVRGYPAKNHTPPPARPRTTPGASASGASPDAPELKIPDKTGPHLYEVSRSDWDAAVRWVGNLAENVRYTRQVHGDKVLTGDDVKAWTDFWRRWLLFGNKMEASKAELRDESLASKVLAFTSPLLWASRKLYITAKGALALMSKENKRELDGLLHEAWQLYRRLRNAGMSQVAIPYMGELVAILRSHPRNSSLSDMTQGLRDAAAAGERLLDENTAWWQWRVRDDSRGLARAVEAAKKSAQDFAELARASKHVQRSEQVRAREILLEILHRQEERSAARPGVDLVPPSPAAAVYDEFARIASKVFVEAAGLYGIEETRRTTRAELRDDLSNVPGRAASTLGWLLAAAGVGYLGLRWLTSNKKTTVVESPKVGYHPDVDNDGVSAPESEYDHGI